MKSLQALFKPRSVAIIGASGDASKTAGRPAAYLQKHGFSGKIFPVNPKLSEVQGMRCYPDIASLPEVPDVAIVLLGAERSISAVKSLAEIGTKAAIVLASGFAETGDTGIARQQQLQQAAGSMRILGPNTIGLVNLTDKIVLSASGALEMEQLPAGGIGVISQSGGILGSLLSRAAGRGIGLSKLVSTSNEMDLELADFIDDLAQDDATQVIALYIEAIRNPEKFRLAAHRAMANGKALVAFKIGRSEAGARAAVSHTGALAGSDRMYDAFFKETGVIRARSFSDLLDIPMALSSGRKLGGRSVAILTSTGGAGTLVSDDLGVNGFATPAPDVGTAQALRALQTGEQAALDRNPIDVTLAGLQPDLMRSAIRILLASTTYDALVIIVGSSNLAMPDLMANAIRDCMSDSAKPIIAFVSPHAPDVASLLIRRGIPAFTTPESCSVALAAMLQVTRHAPVASVAGTAPVTFAQVGKGALNEAQSKQLFSQFGISCARELVVTTSEQAAQAAAALGGPVALKVLSNTITHKSDIGGVALHLSAQTIASHYVQMQAAIQQATGQFPEQFLVQTMVSGGVEMILGMNRDSLGAAILLGMGGVTAELFNDTSIRMVPQGGALTLEQATDMMRELKSWPLLNGYRGKPLADVHALRDAVVAFSRMVGQLGNDLLEAEINPLFVLPAGSGVAAADGVVIFRE